MSCFLNKLYWIYGSLMLVYGQQKEDEEPVSSTSSVLCVCKGEKSMLQALSELGLWGDGKKIFNKCFYLY